jgi:hypothetical protein
VPQLAIHALIVVALIVAYTVVTVANHDATALLGVLVGYIGGAGSAVAVAKANGGISGSS